jgi:hypothetical protein
LDSQFFDWAKDFYDYALVHYANWQIPTPQTVIEPPLAAFGTAFTKFQNPIQPTDHGRQPRKQGVFRPRLPPPPATPPTTFPMADKIDTGILRQVTIHFRDNGKHKAKPKGAHGREIPDAPPRTWRPHVFQLRDTQPRYPCF